MIGAVEPDRLPDAIGEIQLLPRRGVFDVRSRDDRRTLSETRQRDRARLKGPTRVAECARHWERDRRGPDRLLRGSERVAAEQWRDAAPRHAPPPDAAALDLMHASCQAESAPVPGQADGRAAAWDVAAGVASAVAGMS